MKIINTAKLTPKSITAQEREWVYNGLDCCLTSEILDVLLPQLDKHTSKTYAFSRALQAPVLDMRMRGVKIDEGQRMVLIMQYKDTIEKLEDNLERIVREGCDYAGFNWRSPDCLRYLFYDIFRIPEERTKEGKVTVNRTALEKLDKYPIATHIVKHMIELREMGKRLSVIQTKIDHDGRIRSTYNIAGTTTGRFSSSLSEFGTGGNLQNIEEALRSMFIADEGMKMANFDAEQGEARVVGAIEWNLFHRGGYLDACEREDLHTAIARLCWPELPWTGDLQRDRDIAERPYYRDYSYRFMCKKLGHGSNYGGRPETIGAQTKIDPRVVMEFQSKYFRLFPAHQMWHSWIEHQIMAYQRLLSLSGRLRHFLGRTDSADVLRDAIAYDPQCSLSDIVKQGMLRVHGAYICELLLENHDSIVVQYPEEKEDEIIPKILKLLHHELPLQHSRTLTIPYGCQTGWNWGKFSKDNPNGLKDYKPNDKRSRAPEVDILDRKLH